MRFIAKNPPSIAILGGILLILTGNEELGMQVFSTGALLQVGWLGVQFLKDR